jgi:hypothetical protein
LTAPSLQNVDVDVSVGGDGDGDVLDRHAAARLLAGLDPAAPSSWPRARRGPIDPVGPPRESPSPSTSPSTITFTFTSKSLLGFRTFRRFS